MSKLAAATPSPLRAVWLKWRFHINVLLLLVPLCFMPKYFADAALFRGDSGIGEVLGHEAQRYEQQQDVDVETPFQPEGPQR